MGQAVASAKQVQSPGEKGLVSAITHLSSPVVCNGEFKS